MPGLLEKLKMKHYEIRQIGLNRGHRRIWLQGALPRKAGFTPGVKYNIKSNIEKSTLVLEVVENGVRVVSTKKRGDTEHPLIDIESNDLLKVFEGMDTVRVIVQAGKIFIMPIASEQRAKARLERLRTKLENGEPLSLGSLSSGIGILDSAAHTGLKNAGLESELAFANEIRDDCMEHAIERNPGFTDKTITLTAPMQELCFDQWAMSQIPEVDGLVAGIPCSAHSKAGRTKLKLEHPEDHESVGHLCVAFLAVIARVNPSFVILENVPPYRTSASMSIIRNQLRDLGYDVHETELNAADWGMLEHRKRMCMVAVTKGIAFDIEAIKPPIHERKTFGDIMEQVDPNHSTWGSIDYLWTKRDRDVEKGSGFAPTVIDAKSHKIPTLNKTLHKRQSTGTFIQHPENENLYRIPTLREHAGAKGISFELIGETTQTFGHEAMGQAISVPPFVSAFETLGRALVDFGRQAVSAVSFSMPARLAVG